MGENSKIEWTSHTFNPWRGCTKVSPGCDHCYAERGSKRNPKVLGVWGDDGTRVVASDAYWREPIRWNREAERAGERRRVFCASLADVCEDRRELDAPRARLAALIDETPWLLWLLLSKRPQNYSRLFSSETLRKCGIGTSTEDQPRADERIPLLLKTPAAFRFISAEPLLNMVDIRPWLSVRFSCEDRRHPHACGCGRLDWVIVGGESGAGARTLVPYWVLRLVNDCKEAGVPVFVKQLGAKPLGLVPPLRDKKGGNPEEWPEGLRVRQFPHEWNQMPEVHR